MAFSKTVTIEGSDYLIIDETEAAKIAAVQELTKAINALRLSK